MSTELITRLHEVIDALAGIDPHDIVSDMAHIEQTEALLAIGDQLDGIVSRRLQVMHSRNTTTVECGRQTKAWLVEEQRRSGPEATRRMVVARALPERPEIDRALTRGEINLEHAHVIV